MSKAPTRINTFFNVIIPPWKIDTLEWGKYVTLRFVIQDYFPSTKNKKSVWTERSEAKKHINTQLSGEGIISKKEAAKIAMEAVFKVNSRIVGSEAYKEFVKNNKEKLQQQMQKYSLIYSDRGLIFPLGSGKIKTKFYFKTAYRLDSISKEESTMDLLVAAGVIADDNRFVLKDAKREARSYKDEILQDIAEIFITVNLKNGKGSCNTQIEED